MSDISKEQAEKIFAERTLARRRLLYFTKATHPAYEAGWVHDDISRRLERFSKQVVEKKSPRLMLLMPPRHGKLLAHSTEVLTQNRGWITHGELVVGDLVFHPSGLATRVIGLSDEGVASREVVVRTRHFPPEFERIGCHPEHEWRVSQRAPSDEGVDAEPYVPEYSVLETRDLECGMRLPPVEGPLIFSPATGGFEESAWLLGTQMGMASCEGYEAIPREVMFGSVATRGSFVDGLSRTYRNKLIEAGNKGLAQDLVALLRSVGFRATSVKHTVKKDVWEVSWLKFSMLGHHFQYIVEDVRAVRRPVKGRCIQVESPDGMYLVTRTLIPTHNSELSSIRFPAWHLGHNPTHEVINVGYNLDLPMKFSRKVREVMREPLYKSLFPGTELDPQAQGVENWNTTKAGGFQAAGVGGGITGKGCFAPTTVVDTLNGSSIIQDLTPGDFVYGYNHNTSSFELTRVIAVSVARHTVGAVYYPNTGINCTPDHQLYTRKYGYVEAHKVESLGLSVLRRKKSVFSGRLFEVLSSASSGFSFKLNLRAVFGGFFASGGGTKEARGTWCGEPRFLQRTMQQKVACGASAQGSWGLPVVSETASSQGPKKVLFSDLFRSKPGKWFGLSRTKWGVLRSLFGFETSSYSPRPAPVCNDTFQSFVGSTPYRPLRSEQHDGQFNYFIEGGARVLSFVEGRSARSIAHLVQTEGQSEQLVYDVQTELGNLVADGIVAHNCHILIIDDPCKNQEEADSALYRDKMWDWYQSTAYTRLAPGGGVLLVQTWWNDDDLAGRLQQMMQTDNVEADQFEVVKYPALSTHWEYRDNSLESTPILRYDTPLEEVPENYQLLRPKEFCLHESRYPTDSLKRIRANLQPRIWSALYQQNPVPDEGMYFRKEFFRYQATMPTPTHLRIYTAWDFAIGEKQQNDWTVGATILQDENDTLYVLEIFRMKGDSFQIIEAILDVAQRWGTISQTGYLIGAEDGQIWRAIEPMFKKRCSERKQYPAYEVLRPLSDKVARARPLQGRMQQGRVIFLEGAAWLAQAEQELLRFPAGTHDDVVDALAWATHLCIGKPPPKIPIPEPLTSWRSKLLLGSAGNGSHMSA